MKALNDIRQYLIDIKHDFKRLWQASKITLLSVLLLEIFIGSSLVIELAILSQMIDGVVGARSLQIWTSDITRNLCLQVGFFVILIMVIFFQQQFTGLAAKFGKQVREIAFVILTFFVSLATTPIGFTLALVGFVTTASSSSRIIRLGTSLGMIGTAIYALINLFSLVIYKNISLGQMIWWGGAALTLSGFFALRLHQKSKIKTQ